MYELILQQLQADFHPDPGSKTAGLLVKKWTSIIRLQKKVCNANPLRSTDPFVCPDSRS